MDGYLMSPQQGLQLLTVRLERLVVETLEPLPQDRKCFRMVNGVLAERTVKDVLPLLKTNSDGLKQVLEEMLKQYKTKQSELDSWKVRTVNDRTETFGVANPARARRKRITSRWCSPEGILPCVC